MKSNVKVANLINENAALKAELAEVKGQLSWLLEQLSSSRRKLFGASSEKSVYDQIGLFQEDTRIIPVSDPIPVPETGNQQSRHPKKRGEMGSRLPVGLPVETIECVLPEDNRNCPVCGGSMHTIGKEVARRELKIIPAKAVVTEYVRYAYSCRKCEESSDGSVPVIKATLPPQVIKGSLCSPETVAHIAVQKCVMGSPLYRQEQEWKRKGIPITRQTMANWLIRCSEDYLEPIYDELHRRLCKHKFLHSDGTTFQVLREPDKPAQNQSCMWVYRTSGDAKNPIVMYDYQPDKTKERPREFLKSFSGYLITDGYSAYHSLPDDITVVGCLAHVRRGFTDALKVIKKAEDRNGSLALIGKNYCDKLFEIEREANGKTFDERYAIRNKKAVPVLDEFYYWLTSIEPHVAEKSKIGKAVNYSINQWKYLERYLLDGRIECSNNRAERSIKPFVINRKNFLFATSVPGARAAAVIHSMTETAKESGLDPFEYLTYVFKTAAGVNLRENRNLIDALLPESAPTHCRISG